MQTKIVVPVVVLGMLAIAGCGGSEPPAQTPPPTTSVLPPVAASAPGPLPAPAPPATSSLGELELASVKAAADALNQHDPEKYAALFTTDAVDRGTNEPDRVGHDAIAAHVKDIFDTFPDFKISFGRVWQKGNLVARSFAWTGTDTGGGFKGNKPTGRPAGIEGIAITTYTDDGLVKELHRYGDTATLMSQLDPKAKKGSFRAPPVLPASMEVVASTGAPDDDKLLDVAKGFYAALDNKKAADVMAIFTEESTADDFTTPMPLKGLKDWKAMYDGYVGAFPDFKQSLSNQLAIKDFVISEGVLNGTHKGAIGPIRGTGKPVSIHFVDIAQFKDNKIVHFWTWSNSAELLTEIGVMKPPGAASAAKSAAPAKAPAAAPKR